MNERAFIRSCIKVLGFILLVWGLMGVAVYAVNAGVYWVMGHGVISDVNSLGEAGTRSAVALQVAFRKSVLYAVARIPGYLLYAGAGLYLCRRYQRPLKWLLKDEPTAT